MPTEPKNDRIGADYKQGPNPQPGGEVDLSDREVPPYEGRTTGVTGDPNSRTTVERQLAETDSGRPGATASPAVESPVREEEVTDQEPETPHGVGESVGGRGEDHGKATKEPGRFDLAHEGGADRPAGGSTDRDISGV
jgi:hypothetical protein